MKLELRGITKVFGSLVANDDINLVIEPGEIHALLGENGAGKSTLMNVLYGLYAPDGGQILIDGTERRFTGPGDAVAAGIGMVHQHFMLVPVFTVAESVALGYEPTKGLDAPASAEVGLAMQRRAAQGGLVIFSCHDPEFCVRYATMNAVLMNGELVAYDTPRAIIARQDYSTTSVHRLLRERDPEALVPEDTGVGP